MAQASALDDNALPDDWENQVARAYSVLTPDEFGIWGKLDTAFLRKKAEDQLRDQFGKFRKGAFKPKPGQDVAPGGGVVRGRFVKEPSKPTGPGKIPPHLGAQGVTSRLRSTVRPPHGERIAISSVGPAAERPRLSAADVAAKRNGPVQRLSGRKAKRALADAGVPPEAVEYYTDRGEVFTRDGATLTWVPNQDEAEVLRRERQVQERLFKARGDLEDLQAKPQQSREDAERADALKGVVADLEKEHGKVRTQAEKERLGPSKVSDEDAAMAEQALEILERAVDEVPEWRKTTRDGKRRPFMAVMNGDMLVGEATGETVPGGYYMVIDPKTSDTALQKDKESEWSMDVDTESDMEYTMFHEMGHLVDSVSKDDPMSAKNSFNRDLWHASAAMDGMSRYGETLPEEGLAEAWVGLQLNESEVPMASLMYALWFGWLDDKGGRTPSPPPDLERIIRQLAKHHRAKDDAGVARQKKMLWNWLTQYATENQG